MMKSRFSMAGALLMLLTIYSVLATFGCQHQDTLALESISFNEAFCRDLEEIEAGADQPSTYSSGKGPIRIMTEIYPVLEIDGWNAAQEEEYLHKMPRSDCYWALSGSAVNFSWELVGHIDPFSMEDTTCNTYDLAGCTLTHPYERETWYCNEGDKLKDYTAEARQLAPEWFNRLGIDVFVKRYGYSHDPDPDGFSHNGFNACEGSPTYQVSDPMHAPGQVDFANHPYCIADFTPTIFESGEYRLHAESAGAASLNIVKTLKPKISMVHNYITIARRMTPQISEHEDRFAFQWIVPSADGSDWWEENFSPNIRIAKMRIFYRDNESGPRYVQPEQAFWPIGSTLPAPPGWPTWQSCQPNDQGEFARNLHNDVSDDDCRHLDDLTPAYHMLYPEMKLGLTIEVEKTMAGVPPDLDEKEVFVEFTLFNPEYQGLTHRVTADREIGLGTDVTIGETYTFEDVIRIENLDAQDILTVQNITIADLSPGLSPGISLAASNNQTPSFAIDPGRTVTFDLSFAPAVYRRYAGRVTFNIAGANQSYTHALDYELDGVAPILYTQDQLTPFTEELKAFDSGYETITEQLVLLSNVGAQPLTIDRIYFSGDHPQAFEILHYEGEPPQAYPIFDLPLTLSPGGFMPLMVRYTPLIDSIEVEDFHMHGSNRARLMMESDAGFLDLGDDQIIHTHEVDVEGSFFLMRKITTISELFVYARGLERFLSGLPPHPDILQRSIVVVNNGLLPATIDDMTLSGSEAEAFTLLDEGNHPFAGPVVIPSGGMRTFKLAYLPVVSDPSDCADWATLEITSGARIQTEEHYYSDTCPLTLLGLHGDADAVARPGFNLTPSQIHLGVGSGNHPSEGVLSIQNNGNATLNISQMTLLGEPPHPQAFSLMNTQHDPVALPLSIPAQSQEDIIVRYEPVHTSGSGTNVARLVVTPDLRSAPFAQEATLYGAYHLEQTNGPGMALSHHVLTFSSADFGKVKVAEKSLFVINHGDDELQLQALSMTGKNTAAFGVVHDHGSLPISIPGGESKEFLIRYAPLPAMAKTMAHEARLEFQSNRINADASAFIKLKGSYAPPAPKADGAVLALYGEDLWAFSKKSAGKPDVLEKKLVVGNSGKETLILSNIAITGKHPSAFGLFQDKVETAKFPMKVPPGASTTFTVKYLPSSKSTQQVHEAQVVIKTNGVLNPTRRMSLWATYNTKTPTSHKRVNRRKVMPAFSSGVDQIKALESMRRAGRGGRMSGAIKIKSAGKPMLLKNLRKQE